MPNSELRPHNQLRIPAFRGPPAAISKPVLALCGQLSPQQEPRNVRCEFIAGMRAHMCFDNVRSLASTLGGLIVFGWLIWEWKDNYLEAEHHAVWNRGGTLVDVTPHNPQRTDVVFLPDPVREFDFEHRTRIDNLRVPLRKDAKVREYLQLSAAFVQIEEDHSVGSEVVLTADANFQLDRIRWRLRELEKDLALWSLNRIGRNDVCCCGSGKKFKSCCIQARGQVAFPAPPEFSTQEFFRSPRPARA